MSDLMTLHIFSSSSHNKNSLFCSCLDGGGGGGREIRFKEQTSMTVLWNKPSPFFWVAISEASVTCPASSLPRSVFHFVSSITLIARLDSSFSLISSSVHPLLSSSINLYYSSILSSPPYSDSPQSPRLLFFFFLSSITRNQLSHELEAKLWNVGKCEATVNLSHPRNYAVLSNKHRHAQVSYCDLKNARCEMYECSAQIWSTDNVKDHEMSRGHSELYPLLVYRGIPLYHCCIVLFLNRYVIA